MRMLALLNPPTWPLFPGNPTPWPVQTLQPVSGSTFTTPGEPSYTVTFGENNLMLSATGDFAEGQEVEGES